MRLVVPLLAASVAGFGVLPPPAKPWPKPCDDPAIFGGTPCASRLASLAKIAALANTCVYRLSPYLVDALGGLEFVNRTYCEPMRLAGWDIVESYSAASVEGDTDNADLLRTASGDCIFVIHGADWEQMGDEAHYKENAVTNETAVLYGVPGFSKTHAAEVSTILGKVVEKHGSLAAWAATCPGDLHVSGHSMGGAAASIIAYLANKIGDPMGMQKTVSEVHLFGSNPGASFTMTNDQSASGCFEGSSYYSRVPRGTVPGYGDLVDFAIANGHASSDPWVAYAWAPYPGVMLHPKIEHTSLDMTGPPTKNGTAAGVGIFLDKSKLAGPALVTPCGQDPPALVETLANATLGLKSVGEGSSPPFQGTLESYGLHMPWVYAAQFD